MGTVDSTGLGGKPMTLVNAQKIVLDYMERLNIGAILFDGAYRFPKHFRDDATLAFRYWANYLSDDQDGSEDADNWLSVEDANDLTD